eukprot:CAMPEP_0171472948 /NCGR_PEP_ID=MMETSP0946-20130122/1565_1 /TAXON_ID=109269 /ORGANISM="Vaucheria litorea, Strain CCMP2940" /LENGTH=82 /DNA_ID=CAMNT_0012002649 /DNA_START=240 /DNA_END=488 /DNA_ORIENTATION=+
MARFGIDIKDQKSDYLSSYNSNDFDAVISMCGCGASLPSDWTERPLFMDWNVEDPDGKDDKVFERVSLEIKDHIEDLISKLD